MFVTNWISTTKIQKISEITNFFRHYFLSRTEVNFATQQPFSLLLLLQEPFLLAERKKMCYLSMATNQSQYTNINSFILGYIY